MGQGILRNALGRLQDWLLTDHRRLERGPIVHHFPEVGVDGQISLDIAVWPSARFYGAQHPLRYQKLYLGRVDEPSQRLGAFVVELTQKGLRLRWQAEHPIDVSSAPTPGTDAATNGAGKPIPRAAAHAHDLRENGGNP